MLDRLYQSGPPQLPLPRDGALPNARGCREKTPLLAMPKLVARPAPPCTIPPNPPSPERPPPLNLSNDPSPLLPVGLDPSRSPKLLVFPATTPAPPILSAFPSELPEAVLFKRANPRCGRVGTKVFLPLFELASALALVPLLAALDPAFDALVDLAPAGAEARPDFVLLLPDLEASVL